MFLKKNKNKPPKWFKWGMLIFIAFALINGIFGSNTSRPDVPIPQAPKDQPEYADQSPYNATEVPSVEEFPKLKKTLDMSRWKRALNPNKLREVITHDMEEGVGDRALCGQTVDIDVTGTMPDGTPYTGEAKRTFRIGDGSQPIAIEETVEGMRVGGVRKSSAPLHLLDDSVELTLDAAELSVALNALSPAIEEGVIGYSRELEKRVDTNHTLGAQCGDTVKALVDVANMSGKVEQIGVIEFTLGDPDVPHGFTRALLNTRHGDAVMATLPPAYAHMQEPRPAWAKRLDGTQIVIVRLTRSE